MIAQLRYNLKIVAPTMLWTGILVTILLGLRLFAVFRGASTFQVTDAAADAEQLFPIIAAFFSAGVLDWEMRRGAHELLRSKQRPLWHTVAYRLAVSVGITLLLFTGFLAAVHFGIKRLPFGMLLLAAIPSSLVLGLISLWTRVRLGNAFMGYTVALAAWVANWVTSALERPPLNLAINPLLTLNSYSSRLAAEAAAAVDSTPYVDWWWVNKVALLVTAACIFLAVTRRVENLVEGD